MGNVPRKIGAIPFLQDVASIRCPHLHRTGENEEHLLPIMLLPLACGLGSYMEQKCLHQAVLGSEQLKAISTRILQGPIPAGSAADPHGLVCRLFTE